jgi:serine/threonine-protein kinase RsbW
MAADAKAPRRLDLRNDIADLDRLSTFVQAIAEEEKLNSDQLFAVGLCLEEAVTNIIMHGGIEDRSGTPISLTVLSGAPDLAFCLEDAGRAFDPTTAVPPDAVTSLEDAPIGGLGIPLMRKMTRNMSYERKDGRNRLVLRFALAAS